MKTYPEVPGSKTSGPSREAARAVATKVVRLRAEVLRLLSVENLTADEAAERMKEHILAVRPRFSELRALNQIEETGERRPSSLGSSSAVWRAL